MEEESDVKYAEMYFQEEEEEESTRNIKQERIDAEDNTTPAVPMSTEDSSAAPVPMSTDTADVLPPSVHMSTDAELESAETWQSAAPLPSQVHTFCRYLLYYFSNSRSNKYSLLV